MSFDALTIGGLLLAIISGAFLIGLVRNNDSIKQQRTLGMHDGDAHSARHVG
ncbi:hypothetical protein [Thiohalocapsa marina]|uniref:hypothetical protein n=1 Tax=Thiohalocapsa marina TaxID=424902 RepID=UPI0014798094|nr:hypothetical protein [Thiohalocapsa marina]